MTISDDPELTPAAVLARAFGEHDFLVGQHHVTTSEPYDEDGATMIEVEVSPAEIEDDDLGVAYRYRVVFEGP